MEFADYLSQTAGLINKQLAVYFLRWSRRAGKIHPGLSHLVQVMVEANRGGKRLRGTLVRLGYELSGTPYNPEILKPALALEIFQTALLTHDDIIDRSKLRRGKPTVQQALGGDHYATSQAICLGDEGIFASFELLAEANFPPEAKNRAMLSFCHTGESTVLGEMLDIALPTLADIQEEDFIKMAQLKTARYSVTGPLRLGAILAEMDEARLNKLRVYGDNLGIAFQIKDDLLGVFGDEKELGKSVTSDIEEGKMTLLFIKAMGKASMRQKDYLKSCYGRGKIDKKTLETVREVFRDTGSLEYSEELMKDYVKKAKKQVRGIAGDTHHAKLLTQLADYLIQRNR